jgi:Dolichyl-phosphate-mannose-protein mannosyltransferase
MSVVLPARRTEGEPAEPPRSPAPTRRWVDAVLVAALLPLALVARRPGYLFSHSFFLDEGWVADSVRAPLSQLRLLSSSTPIGWTLLLRLVPDIGPPERLRALPLLFGVLSVVLAYLLGRRIGRVAAVAAGLAAAVAPTALQMHSLKQYSADVCVVLLLLWLTARVERAWSPGRLLVLCLACLPAMLLSHATAFASVAVLGALALVAVARRQWRRLGWLVGLGAGVAAALAANYVGLVATSDNPAMARSWADDMVPVGDGLIRAGDFLITRITGALGDIGFGPWPLALAAVAAGLVALCRSRLPAVAVAVVLLAAELLAGGLTGRYPFLDPRTSTFFTTLLTVCGALGVAAVVTWAARRPLTLPLGVALALGAGVLLAQGAHRGAMQPLPPSTLRQQVEHVLAHRQPGDVVVVGWAASFTFAYYWPERPSFAPTTISTAVLFQVEYPDRPDLILIRRTKRPDLVFGAVREAAARTRSGRVWLVAAEAGDRSSAQVKALNEIGQIIRRPLPRLAVVDPPEARAG